MQLVEISVLVLFVFSLLLLSLCCTRLSLSANVTYLPADGRRMSNTLGTKRVTLLEQARFAQVSRLLANKKAFKKTNSPTSARGRLLWAATLCVEYFRKRNLQTPLSPRVPKKAATRWLKTEVSFIFFFLWAYGGRRMHTCSPAPVVAAVLGR